jgi:hypothetical protein
MYSRDRCSSAWTSSQALRPWANCCPPLRGHLLLEALLLLSLHGNILLHALLNRDLRVLLLSLNEALLLHLLSLRSACGHNGCCRWLW